MAVASAVVDTKAYTPMNLLLTKEAHIKVMAVGLGAANAILSSLLCTDPMLPLVNTLAIFKATLDSDSMVLKDKKQVAKVGDYLAKLLATVVTLMDKSTPTVAALLMPSHMASKVGREGLVGPSCLILPAELPAEFCLPSWLS